MIYEYEIVYDSVGAIDGYVYTIPTSGTPITFKLKADGVFNDTPELQGLLDEIGLQGGGTLILPSNTEIAIKRHIINGAFQSYGISLPSNITLKSSGGKCTLVSDFTLGSVHYWMILAKDKTNIIIEDICFLGNENTSNGVYIDGGSSVTITNCEFREIIAVEKTLPNGEVINPSASCISARNVQQLRVEDCYFSRGEIGIGILGRNRNVYLKDSFFENLTNNPIRVFGNQDVNEFTENLWITGNEMNVARVSSYISDTQAPRFDDGRVNFPMDQASKDERAALTGISAINTAVLPQQMATLYHQNVVIADNIANGSDYGFFDGGSADLFSLKDIIRLKCYGNTARNSGDLGFAIERCRFAVIANNTADRNNSCGISIFDSNNVDVTGNICSNNELSRDGVYANNPYGGIRVEHNSIGVFVDGNYCYADRGVKRSFQNILNSNSNYIYNEPEGTTQRYGIVVKNQGGNVPFNVKVGMNHMNGMLFGTVFNNVRSTQILDTYTGIKPPTKGDYPLGARLRNNLMSSSTLSTTEWQVSNRVQMSLFQDAAFESSTLQVTAVNTVGNLLNEGIDVSNKVYENIDMTTIQAGDVIGVLLDDHTVHWTTVTSITVNGQIGTITIQDILPFKASSSVMSDTFNKRVVSLRWEALK